ncbi:nuclease-related domain-containing protein [Candidatus Viridilinea mediisalina]|uniref:Nuclease n=1 Tax=Candidatus Viridilinea mediisalina TaxID=2024553 RepID=A0A2A6RPH8_9CHLR|nr:nuclease-related domain-containing protein [Candidatus Viridilinea mediisalina]PDW04760.1 nuclease [Candidatus Viridilinea mediisalina]
MAVQVWIGETPEHPNERRAIMALANGLHELEGLYLILANFSVGGRTVDLVIIKHDAIFILELKHCDGRVLGSVNGPWFVEGRNGERKRLNPGRKNPYNQVISYFHALTNFLNEHRREFLSAQKTNDVDFRTCKRAVVLAPSIQDGSEIELDWKVELKGLDELPAYLITERSSEIQLNEEEMLAIPALLHCTPWHEINTVLRGVVPDPNSIADPLDTITTSEATQTIGQPPALEEPPSPAVPPMAAWRAITAVALVFAAILVLALLLRPVQSLPVADAPARLPEINGMPTGDAFPIIIAGDAARCQWTGYQLVAKRYDPATRSWLSVAEGAATPEVIIALEQVAACSGTIELTWSVQNNWDRPIEFPLQAANIKISDGLGNQYPIDDNASSPATLVIAAGNQARGSVNVNRPLSSSATSLLVRLRDQPFGEASFVVALQP